MNTLHAAEQAVEPDAAHQAGRSCPLHYRYDPGHLNRAAEHRCEVLYVVGGLYGNEPALDTLLELFERESGPKRLVFNGDFNWFDIDPDLFLRLNHRVLQHVALRGNVETELAADADEAQDDAGCGCGYPEWVAEEVVQRSNRIMSRLRQTANAYPALVRQLAALPMTCRVDVGALRVAVVHGDAASLAGWGFAQEQLRQPQHQAQLRTWFQAAAVDVFACSHTCLPVFHGVPMPGRAVTPLVVNNGAAGMPNFRGEPAGLLTRIAVRPFDGPQRRYGVMRGDVHLEAIAIPYDQPRWTQQFLQQWPPGSDAHASYWQRIHAGPLYERADACHFERD